jgi:hypothetical protein
MAKHTEVRLIDDLTGKPADETVAFDLDGRSYLIDLSAANAKKLRTELQPYIEVSATVRPAGRRGSTTRTRRTLTAVPAADNSAIRAWAISNGIDIAERGRIAAHIIEAFDAAHRR